MPEWPQRRGLTRRAPTGGPHSAGNLLKTAQQGKLALQAMKTEAQDAAEYAKKLAEEARRKAKAMVEGLLEKLKDQHVGDGVFKVKRRVYKVSESAGKCEILVNRVRGNDAAMVVFHTLDGTAKAGKDYGFNCSALRFAAGEKQKKVTIVIYDDSSVATEDKIFQVKFYCGGGSFANNTLRDECKIKIIDEDANILKRISESGPFQILSALATLWALFGPDICVMHLEKDTDFTTGMVTFGATVFFFIEIVLLSLVKGWKYFGSLMFWMDNIAMIAMLPSIPWVEPYADAALSSAGDTGIIARAGRAARAGSRAGRSIKLPRLIGKVVGALIFLATAFGGKKETEEEKAKKAKEAEEPAVSPSAAGAQVLEMFTGKVILMMMLVLVAASFLVVPQIPTQKEMGLKMLENVLAASGDQDSESFRRAVKVFIGDAAISGQEYNPGEELIYLKVNGEVVRSLQEPEDYDNLSYGLDYYDAPETYNRLREKEMRFSGPCKYEFHKTMENHLKPDCLTSAVYDNHQAVHQDALFAIILTVAIVIILGFGMGLMATDLQALLLDPIERLTGMAKVFGGKKKDGDDKGDDKLASAADKLLEIFPKENPLKNFTELIGDLERAFGLRLSRARNVLITLEANLIPRIEALDATLRQFKDGSLRLEDLVAKGKVLFSEEGLRAVLRIDTLPPEAQRAVDVVAKILKTSAGPSVMVLKGAEAIMTQYAGSMGLKVPGGPSNLTIGTVREYTRLKLLEATKEGLEKANVPVPTDLDRMSVAELKTYAAQYMKERVVERAAKMGIAITAEDLSGDLKAVLANLEGIVVKGLVRRLPFEVRSKLSDGAQAKMKPLAAEVKSVMKEVAITALDRLKISRESVNVLNMREVVALVTVKINQQLGIDVSEPAKVLTLIKAMEDIKRGIVDGVNEANPEVVKRKALELLRQADYPHCLIAWIPDASTLPTVEEFEADAKAATMKFLIEIRNAYTAENVTEIVSKGLFETLRVIKKLKEVEAVLGDPRVVEAMSTAELKELLARLPKMFYGLPTRITEGLALLPTASTMTKEDILKMVQDIQAKVKPWLAVMDKLPTNFIEVQAQIAQLKIPGNLQEFIGNNPFLESATGAARAHIIRALKILGRETQGSEDLQRLSGILAKEVSQKLITALGRSGFEVSTSMMELPLLLESGEVSEAMAAISDTVVKEVDQKVVQVVTKAMAAAGLPVPEGEIRLNALFKVVLPQAMADMAKKHLPENMALPSLPTGGGLALPGLALPGVAKLKELTQDLPKLDKLRAMSPQDALEELKKLSAKAEELRAVLPMVKVPKLAEIEGLPVEKAKEMLEKVVAAKEKLLNTNPMQMVQDLKQQVQDLGPKVKELAEKYAQQLKASTGANVDVEAAKAKILEQAERMGVAAQLEQVVQTLKALPEKLKAMLPKEIVEATSARDLLRDPAALAPLMEKFENFGSLSGMARGAKDLKTQAIEKLSAFYKTLQKLLRKYMHQIPQPLIELVNKHPLIVSIREILADPAHAKENIQGLVNSFRELDFADSMLISVDKAKSAVRGALPPLKRPEGGGAPPT